MSNDNKIDNGIVLPAYIRLKYARPCSACYVKIEVGELAFWFGKDKKAYHGKCGSDKWKVKGTPYSIRRSAAIKFAKEEKANKEVETQDKKVIEEEDGIQSV